jgi:hypothetical protein
MRSLSLPVPFNSGLPATCDSRLGGPLIPGMPRDFAAAAMSGLKRDSSAFPLPKGRLRVDRAGHDLMGSSEVAFEQAARLLRVALWAADLPGGRPKRYDGSRQPVILG